MSFVSTPPQMCIQLHVSQRLYPLFNTHFTQATRLVSHTLTKHSLRSSYLPSHDYPLAYGGVHNPSRTKPLLWFSAV